MTKKLTKKSSVKTATSKTATKPTVKKAGIKSTQKQHSYAHKTLTLLRSHKLIVFLSLLVLLFPASYAYSKYQDWDNAQMIKGLAKDFPELVAQIEAETGLDLELKTDCMTTSEKSGGGVRTCELSVGDFGEELDTDTINSTIKNSNKLNNFEEFIYNSGYKFTYRNKKSCSQSFTPNERFDLSCLLAVREANIQLAIEQFSQR